MNTPKRYVVSMLADSLGLLDGTLREEGVPDDLADKVISVLSGEEPEFQSPVLEEKLFEFLRSKEKTDLEASGIFVRKLRWPKGANFAICLTHDVDNLSRPLNHIFKVRKRFGLVELLGAILGLTSLYNNIDRIASQEERKGYHSSFYFLTQNYSLREIKQELAGLKERGWDIGLHGDFGTHDSLERMRAAVESFSSQLEFKPLGIREHFLKFDFKKTWDIMEQLGFEYDTSLGTTDKLGFRLGLASPFYPPNSQWEPMKLLEIPLTLMDTTLWGYLKKTEAGGMNDIREMISKVQSVQGVFTLLWHQESVRMMGGRLYWRLLEEFKHRGCFVASAAEIASWWRLRSTPLVGDGNVIRFRGEAPMGLELSIKTKNKVSVTGGHLEATADGLAAFVESGDFRITVGN